ncbi:MAG: thiamine pyrophosphate-binding protein [Actinomycetota bacterium]
MLISSGADVFARTLHAQGITTVFGLCGDHTNPIFGSCAEQGIRIVDARDERGAGWMAAGWALATGQPGVVLVSNTPALTNAATALADAHASGIPLVCVTGGVAMSDRGRGHPGDLDQVAIARPLSGWAERAEHAEQVGALTARALHETRGPRPDVAVLELPLDVQQAAVARESVATVARARTEPEPAVLARARAALRDAERPVIVAGSGCFWSGAAEPLRALVEAARIPLFTVRAARGLVPDDHELCFGFPNLLTEPAQIIFGDADVALIAGSELDVLLGNGAFHPGCTMIRIDADPRAFALGRPAEIEIAADPRATLEALGNGATALPTDAWVKRLREAADARAAAVRARRKLSSVPLHPGRLVAEVVNALPTNAIVCVDGGEIALWAIDAFTAREPASLAISSTSQLGALGMGLPTAVGMKIARHDRPVLALSGDGSFGFTAMEIETAARHHAPVAIVVANDGGWGIVRHLQEALHGRPLASDLPRSPYEMLAEFAGGVGDVVRTPRQLAIAVENALAADVPSIVNAMIDPRAQHEAIPLIAAMFEAKRG